MIDAAPGFDVLSDVLQIARLHSTVMGRLDLQAPWALRMREHGCAVFHLIAISSRRPTVVAGSRAAG